MEDLECGAIAGVQEIKGEPDGAGVGWSNLSPDPRHVSSYTQEDLLENGRAGRELYTERIS